MHVCFCCVCFSSLVLSKEVGWEEHQSLILGWVGYKTLTQSISSFKFINNDADRFCICNIVLMICSNHGSILTLLKILALVFKNCWGLNPVSIKSGKQCSSAQKRIRDISELKQWKIDV